MIAPGDGKNNRPVTQTGNMGLSPPELYSSPYPFRPNRD